MDIISVIIPIYNMQTYLGRCIESIINQKYQNLEIVCIDDGSVDLSGDICKEYQKKDERIRYYKLPNGGVSNARNYALSVITGSWFAFIDADDWIEPDYIERLYNNAIINNCTISACTYQKNAEYMQGYDSENVKIEIFSTPNECIKNFICSRNSMEGMVWNKLYLAEKYKDIRFDTNIKVNEDCLYTYEIMKRCDKACWCSAKMYHWFMRSDSACHTKKIECDFTPANVFLKLYEETLGLSDESVMRTLKKNYVCSIIKILRYTKYSKKNTEVIEAKKRCKEWIKDIWKSFSYKMKILYFIYVVL